MSRRYKIYNQPVSRILNKRYWPYQFKMLTNRDDAWAQVAELERWCYDNFPSGDWRNFGLHFAFKRREYATMFALKWL